MGQLIDLTGQRFGRWTVLRYSGKKSKNHYWKCKCDCGTEKEVRGSSLTSGGTLSCGCLISEFNRRTKTTHGGKNTRLYRIWGGMKNRCGNEREEAYKDYGGRGIKVCEEWERDFSNFYKWAMENGYSKELTIDRIDVNGNYCPENCRWVNMKIQCNNRRNNHRVTYKGRTQTIAEWENELGFKKDILSTRLSNGWSVEKAIETPYKQREFKHNYKEIKERKVCIEGGTYTLREWCKIMGLNARTIVKRIDRGMDAHEALTTPIKKGGG